MKIVFFGIFLLLFLWGKLLDVKIITIVLISAIFLNKIYNAGLFSFNNRITVLVIHQRSKEKIKEKLCRDFEKNHLPTLMKHTKNIFATINMHKASTRFNLAHHLIVVKMNFSKIKILQNFVELCLMSKMFCKDDEPDWKIFFDVNEIIVIKFAEYYKSDIFKWLHLSEIEPQKNLFSYFQDLKIKLKNMGRRKNQSNTNLNVTFFKEREEIKEKQGNELPIETFSLFSKKMKDAILKNQSEKNIEIEIVNFRSNNEIEKIFVVNERINFKYKLNIAKMNKKEFASGILNLSDAEKIE